LRETSTIFRGQLVTTTIQAMLTEAFQKLGIVSEGRQPTPTQSANGLTISNDNILTQMRDGWTGLGWYPQTQANLTSNAPLKDEDIGDIKLMMAAWIAPHYGVTIASSPDPTDLSSLGNQIKEAYRRLNKRYLRYVECDLGELSRPQGGPWGGPNWL
jgi:hypothetical protein